MRYVVVLLCAAVFGLVGCGGDDDSPGGDGEPDAAGSEPDAREPGDGDGPVDAGDEPDSAADFLCDSSSTLNGVTYAATCRTSRECECTVDGQVVDTCTTESDLCTTVITEDEVIAACCEFARP